jgi:hypothetical protein
MTEDATGNPADSNALRVYTRIRYGLKSARASYQYFFGRPYNDKSIDFEITKLFWEAQGRPVPLPRPLLVALMLREDFNRGRGRGRIPNPSPELREGERAEARERFKARAAELMEKEGLPRKDARERAATEGSKGTKFSKADFLDGLRNRPPRKKSGRK